MRRAWTWFAGLSRMVQMVVILFGLIAVSALSENATTVEHAASAGRTSGSSLVAIDVPSIHTEEAVQENDLPFERTQVESDEYDLGERVVTTEGQPGVEEQRFLVTYIDGEEVQRTLVETATVREPVDEVTTIGTYEPPVAPAPFAAAPPANSAEGGSGCHGSYSGACVPIASDVDCAGGSGNGPAYVNGPVYIDGDDPYDLDRDRDGDGVACEPW